MYSKTKNTQFLNLNRENHNTKIITIDREADDVQRESQ